MDVHELSSLWRLRPYRIISWVTRKSNYYLHPFQILDRHVTTVMLIHFVLTFELIKFACFAIQYEVGFVTKYFEPFSTKH